MMTGVVVKSLNVVTKPAQVVMKPVAMATKRMSVAVGLKKEYWNSNRCDKKSF